MNYIPIIVSIIMAIHCLLEAFGRPSRGKKIFSFCAYVFLAAGGLAFLFLQPDRGEEGLSNYFCMSSAWMPVLVTGVAVIIAGYNVVMDLPLSRRFWLFSAAFCLIGAVFGCLGFVNHLSLDCFFEGMPWILLLVALANGIVVENLHGINSIKSEKILTLLLASTGTLIGWFLQYFSIGALTLTSSVFMFGAIVSSIGLAAYLSEDEKNIPFFSIFALIWFVINGVWLEFV